MMTVRSTLSRARFALRKPEYLFRPLQVLRRAAYGWRQASEYIDIRLPWKDHIRVRGTGAIGKALATHGVHELAVSEVLWRLVDRGEACIDVGANVGVMTSLLSARVGGAGRVFAFEPHPELVRVLRSNVAAFANRPAIEIFEAAVSQKDGIAELFEPAHFLDNEGRASLHNSDVKSRNRYRVMVRTLDSIFTQNEQFALLKVDVEGAEAEVFAGSRALLARRAVRDIIWEDESDYPSEAALLLTRQGYKIFRFRKTLFGLAVAPARSQRTRYVAPWESTNYLATVDPNRAVQRLTPWGWQCFRT